MTTKETRTIPLELLERAIEAAKNGIHELICVQDEDETEGKLEALNSLIADLEAVKAAEVKSTKLAIGTRIQFIETLEGSATSDRPACLFATKGEFGVIVGHNDFEGYMVKTDNWRTSFGAVHGTEFIATTAREGQKEE